MILNLSALPLSLEGSTKSFLSTKNQDVRSRVLCKGFQAISLRDQAPLVLPKKAAKLEATLGDEDLSTRVVDLGCSLQPTSMHVTEKGCGGRKG